MSRAGRVDAAEAAVASTGASAGTGMDEAARPAAGGPTPSRALRTLANCVALLGSGGIASVGFAALTSGRVGVVDPAVPVALLLFIQWQVIGITVAKLGVESLVFVMVHDDPTVRPSLRRHVLTRTLPLALVFSAVVGFVFSPAAGAVCFVSVLLDSHAATMIAEWSARERFMEIAFVNLLNYPLFFVALFAASMWSEVGLTAALVIFAGSSVARWLYLAIRSRRFAVLRPVPVVAGASMGMQQLLNFLLFRIDQLFLATALAATAVATQSEDFVRQFVFLARYPELVSNVVVALGAILLPRLFMRHPRMLGDAVQHLRRYRVLVVLGLLGMVLGFAVYLSIWEGAGIPALFALPFFAAALTALPVNAVSYSYIRGSRISVLVRNLGVSVAIGGALLVATYWSGSVYPLLFVVPIQQIAFLSLALFR